MGRSLVACLLLLGCYAPRIEECAFGCGPAGDCPIGFMCNPADQRCYSATPGGSCSYVARHAFTGDGSLGALDLTNSGGTLLVVNTDSGEMKLSGGALTGAISVVPAQEPELPKLKQENGPDIALWSFTTLVIPSSISLQADSAGVPGTVMAFAATDTIDLGGNLTLVGYGKFGGSATRDGGVSDLRTTPARGASGDSGGGGGGYAQAGGDGAGDLHGAGGQLCGETGMRVVHVGGGGGGGAPTMVGVGGGRGGNGGGALALYAHKIRVGGEIRVDGTDGATPESGSNSAGGGGGGAGGSISISGDEVTFDDRANLSARGGTAGSVSPQGGFAGGAGSPGRIWIGGKTDRTPKSDPAAELSLDPATELPRAK